MLPSGLTYLCVKAKHSHISKSLTVRDFDILKWTIRSPSELETPSPTTIASAVSFGFAVAVAVALFDAGRHDVVIAEFNCGLSNATLGKRENKGALIYDAHTIADFPDSLAQYPRNPCSVCPQPTVFPIHSFRIFIKSYDKIPTGWRAGSSAT